MQIIDYVLTHFIGKPLWWSEPCNAALCFTKLSTATRRDRNDMVWNEKIDDLNSDMHAEIGYLIFLLTYSVMQTSTVCAIITLNNLIMTY